VRIFVREDSLNWATCSARIEPLQPLGHYFAVNWLFATALLPIKTFSAERTDKLLPVRIAVVSRSTHDSPFWVARRESIAAPPPARRLPPLGTVPTSACQRNA